MWTFANITHKKIVYIITLWRYPIIISLVTNDVEKIWRKSCIHYDVSDVLGQCYILGLYAERVDTAPAMAAMQQRHSAKERNILLR